MRETHTFACLEVSYLAYHEIRQKLVKAAYSCSIKESRGSEVIDMHGLALKEEATDGTRLAAGNRDDPGTWSGGGFDDSVAPVGPGGLMTDGFEFMSKQELKANCRELQKQAAEFQSKLVQTERQQQALEAVIKEVHAEHADDLCWMPADVNKIFVAAGLPPQDLRVGDKAVMRKNCDRYVDCLESGGPWVSYAQLEAENKRLKERLCPPPIEKVQAAIDCAVAIAKKNDLKSGSSEAGK